MSQSRQTPQTPSVSTPANESPLTQREAELLAAALPASQLAEAVPDHVDVMDHIDAAMLAENPPEPQHTARSGVREVLGL